MFCTNTGFEPLGPTCCPDRQPALKLFSELQELPEDGVPGHRKPLSPFPCLCSHAREGVVGILAHMGVFWCPCDLPLQLQALHLCHRLLALRSCSKQPPWPDSLSGEHHLGESGTTAPWELPFLSFPQDAVKISPPLLFPLRKLVLLSEPQEDSCESQQFSAGEPCKLSKGVKACFCRSGDRRVRQTLLAALSLIEPFSSHSQTWKPWMWF